ncbi:MAG: hypothetical protein R3Y06_04870 [Faecalibacterium sp.]
MNNQEKNRTHNRAFCATAVVWLLLAILLPLSEVWAIAVTLFAMGITYLIVKTRAIK